jgi:hypothetical protein
MSTISPLPPAPQTSSPSTFDVLADAFVAALSPFVTQTNIVASEVVSNRDSTSAYANNSAASATASANSAADALVSANNAASSANVTKWLAATSYTQGAIVWSPINFQTYRNAVAGVHATDPSIDPTNWQLLFSVPDPTGQNGKILTVLNNIQTWQTPVQSPTVMLSLL